MTAHRIAAKRTAVMRQNEALRALEPHALAPLVIRACRAGKGINPEQIVEVTPSHTPRAGANPARLPIVSADLP